MESDLVWAVRSFVSRVGLETNIAFLFTHHRHGHPINFVFIFDFMLSKWTVTVAIIRGARTKETVSCWTENLKVE